MWHMESENWCKKDESGGIYKRRETEEGRKMNYKGTSLETMEDRKKEK